LESYSSSSRFTSSSLIILVILLLSLLSSLSYKTIHKSSSSSISSLSHHQILLYSYKDSEQEKVDKIIEAESSSFDPLF
jgi:hypothetical protein